MLAQSQGSPASLQQYAAPLPQFLDSWNRLNDLSDACLEVDILARPELCLQYGISSDADCRAVCARCNLSVKNGQLSA